MISFTSNTSHSLEHAVAEDGEVEQMLMHVTLCMKYAFVYQ